ncbi:hypothetical protein H261_00495 [Paramagnetospirillum caucaseum]|uniref:Lipoprotein n=2 Tax=Paramagnetospirillum caucaseum TaxID=1244869 RepID=M2ZX72_9PROT|nr:hypothetical protein H261_00495 [Paramagnetospirillum caucaseum]
MIRHIAWLVAAVMVSGCATYSPEEIASLDYGPYPTNYKEIIQSRLNGTLKDPMSAQIEYRAGPKQVWQKGSIITQKTYGWGVCLWLNAKNSFGAYVGRRPLSFIIRNGAIVDAHGEMETNMFDTGLANAMCNQVGAT